jgi:hypothetical protein
LEIEINPTIAEAKYIPEDLRSMYGFRTYLLRSEVRFRIVVGAEGFDDGLCSGRGFGADSGEQQSPRSLVN